MSSGSVILSRLSIIYIYNIYICLFQIINDCIIPLTLRNCDISSISSLWRSNSRRMVKLSFSAVGISCFQVTRCCDEDVDVIDVVDGVIDDDDDDEFLIFEE